MPFRARIAPATLPKRRDAALAYGHGVASRSAVCPYTTRPNPSSSSSLFTPHCPAPGPSTFVSPIRHASTSTSPFGALSNLFSFRRQPQELTAGNATDKYLAAIQSQDASNMWKAYQLITTAMDFDPAPEDDRWVFLTVDQLAAGMDLLSVSSPNGSLHRLQRMYGDVSTKFGYDLDTRHHSAMALGSCRAGKVKDALGILTTLDVGDVNWSELLRTTVTYDPSLVSEVFALLKGAREPSRADYQQIMRDLRRRISRGEAGRNALMELLKEMSTGGVWLGYGGESDLVRIHVLLGDVERAEGLTMGWKENGYTGGKMGKGGWDALCEVAMAQGDNDQLVKHCVEMQAFGLEPPASALLHLVRRELARSGTLERFNYRAIIDGTDKVEAEIGIQFQTHVWSLIIKRMVFRQENGEDIASVRFDNDMLETGINLYREAKARGVEIDASMVRRLVIPLCTATPTRLDDALEIYHGLAESQRAVVELSQAQSMTKIHGHLLMATSKVHDHANALLLLKDMATSGIRLPVFSYSPVVVSLMQSAPDHQTAYTIYTRFYNLNPTGFDRDSFNRLVNAFINLAPSDSGFVLPPVEMFLDIMKTMHLAGIPPSQHLLTSLLSRYGYLATTRQAGMDLERVQDRCSILYEAINDLYLRVKLDPAIDIDIPFLNALMDAYNRVGATSSALSTWDQIVERRSREPVDSSPDKFPASVAIALDVCGRNRLVKRADRIWAWARRHGFASATRTWNGWIENLCRSDQFDRAERVLFVEMKQETEGAPSPDVESARILLKFALGSEEKRERVCRRIQEEFPEWWPELRKVVAESEARQWGPPEEPMEENRAKSGPRGAIDL